MYQIANDVNKKQMQFYKDVRSMFWPVLVHYLHNLTYFAFLCNGSMEYNDSILQFGSSKKIRKLQLLWYATAAIFKEGATCINRPKTKIRDNQIMMKSNKKDII